MFRFWLSKPTAIAPSFILSLYHFAQGSVLSDSTSNTLEESTIVRPIIGECVKANLTWDIVSGSNLL